MNITVVIPVGPGHRQFAREAHRSVVEAWILDHGPFDQIGMAIIPDSEGLMGRSAARNSGVRLFPADWYFFLDADDLMMPEAFRLVSTDSPATFGAVCVLGTVVRYNVYPLTRDMLFEHGAMGTLSMGCFVAGDVARETLFNEGMDAGEDFDFYMRLPGFVKVKKPLVSIGRNKPSAGGPRGYKEIRWQEICNEVIHAYSGHGTSGHDRRAIGEDA